MKKISLCFIILILSTLVHANEDVLAKIKEYDSKMYQGTIEYDGNIYGVNETKFNHNINGNTYRCKVISNKKKNIFSVFEDPEQATISGVTSEYINAYLNYIFEEHTSEAYPKENPDPFKGISNHPNISYGRGLSLLSDIKYNPNTNEVTGISSDKSKVIAKVDPQRQYIAYEIKKIDPKTNSLLSIYRNNNPILVDNKYYIYLTSVYLNEKGKAQTINILSATFNLPTNSDLTYKENHGKENHKITRYPINPILEPLPELLSQFSLAQQETIKRNNKNIDFNNPEVPLIINNTESIKNVSVPTQIKEEKNFASFLVYHSIYIILTLVLIGMAILIIKARKGQKIYLKTILLTVIGFVVLIILTFLYLATFSNALGEPNLSYYYKERMINEKISKDLEPITKALKDNEKKLEITSGNSPEYKSFISEHILLESKVSKVFKKYQNEFMSKLNPREKERYKKIIDMDNKSPLTTKRINHYFNLSKKLNLSSIQNKEFGEFFKQKADFDFYGNFLKILTPSQISEYKKLKSNDTNNTCYCGSTTHASTIE